MVFGRVKNRGFFGTLFGELYIYIGLKCLNRKEASMNSKKNKETNTQLGGGFKYFLISPRTLGKMNPI